MDFDHVNNEESWMVLKEMHVATTSHHCDAQTILWRVESSTTTEYRKREWFLIGKGFRQEYILSS